MREMTPLRGYFDLCKHLCVVNVIVALASVVLLSWNPSGGGPFGVLVLGAFFASFVFAARGMARAVAVMTYPEGGVEGAPHRWFALAMGSFIAGMVGIASYAGVLILA